MIGNIWDMGNTGQVARIYLNDMHGEYTGNLVTKTQGPEKYLNAQVVWDEMALVQATCDASGLRDDMDNWTKGTARVDTVRKTLFPSWPEEWDTGDVWMLEGNLKGLQECFFSLATALDSEISGDDDVFDYWPNTMNMLREFALDLDNWHGYSDHIAKVFEVYHKVKDRFEAGNNPHINFDEEVWQPNG